MVLEKSFALGRVRLVTSMVSGGVAALLLASSLVEAKEGTPNLGGGLEQIAASGGVTLAPKSAAPNARAASGLRQQPAAKVRFDKSGRALVRVSMNGKLQHAAVLQSIRAMPSVEVIGSDASHGLIEAWVPTGSLVGLARKAGVRAVVPVAPAITNVGKVTSQGVVQHRVDKLPPGIDGSGITVGVLSDSYNVAPAETNADGDVATGDLPGPGNPRNSQPVVIVDDSDILGLDEGRAMLQIVHDVAPKARLGFATAEGGHINMANNIRSLAGLPGAPRAVPGFKADVIVDDVSYLDEPWFQDGIIAQAVDEVAAKGIAYFSAAGNFPSTEAYDSKVRIVPATPSSWASTNLNFADVDPALYAGGFHDFDAGQGVDIAQTMEFYPGNTLTFQWNEPYDPQPPVPTGPPIAQGVGTVPENDETSFTFNGTAGQVVEIFVDADDSTTGVPNPDLTLTLLDPNGNFIQFVDTGTVPESLVIDLPVTGTYTVVVDSFLQEQFGDFSYRVQPVTVEERVLTDYNLLFFTMEGNFVGALAEQNRLTNRPIEIAEIPEGQLQMVIARANTPPRGNKNVADRIRYVGYGGAFPDEYYSYLDPVIFGHNAARGGMSVAAYAFFPPYIPEYFTSPGPGIIYFDKNNKRLRVPEIRQKPDMAAMDGANTTFFYSDTGVDADSFPNFFGTSAAAPHAAAIAALVLDAAGGPRKVTPDQMRRILQNSAFPHDLDPYFSWGVAFSGGSLVSINASADGNLVSQIDPTVFTLANFGLRKIKTFTLNGANANVTQTPKGIVFDPRPLEAGFLGGSPFTVGRAVGLSASDVTPKFSIPAKPPGEPGQWQQLDLAFRAGSFRGGDLLSFGVDRDEANVAGPIGADLGDSADLLGGGVLIPSGKIVPGGMKFSGTYEGGGSFSGDFNNLIGKGWSPLDGYGFVNAEAAVKTVLKK